MHETEPKVYLVGHPTIRMHSSPGLPGLEEYLKDVGAHNYAWRLGEQIVLLDGGAEAEGQLLVEIAGRLCYRSWEPGLNPNVKKIREDSQEYASNILNVGHGSVTEHAQYNFIFHNVSRVFTHELVRHRAGVAISQESLRYVRLTDLGFRVPPVLEAMSERVISIVETLEEFQRDAALEFGLDDDGVPFHYKKEVTSALRRLAPIGLSTGMMWSSNIRTLRHVLSMRTANGAEEEIRLVFHRVGEIMQAVCPWYFNDYKVDADGQWVTENWKV